jgi:hypothetical protein
MTAVIDASAAVEIILLREKMKLFKEKLSQHHG